MAFPTLGVKDKDNADQTINTLPAAGRVAEAESLSVALSDEDQADVATELALLGSIDTTLATPATSLPHFALDATNDLTSVTVTRSTSGETSAVSATASQTTRVHRGHITAAGAVTVSLLDGSGGTVLRKWVFPAAGGWDLIFDPRPYAITSANTALYVSTDAAVAVNFTLDYIKSA